MSSVLNGAFSFVRFVLQQVAGIVATPVSYSANYLCILHSSYLVLYHGSDTHVPVTVLEYSQDKKKSSGSGRDAGVKVYLVRKGWRAGLLGWSAAKWLGAKTVKGLDVTPVAEHGRPDSRSTLEGASAHEGKAPTSFPDKQLEKYDKQVQDFVRKANKLDDKSDGQLGTSVRPLATHIVRIPAVADDGYFRLVIQHADGSIATSPDFRIYSFSLSSACPRGASILPPRIPFEMLLRIVSTALNTALLALFPVAAILNKILPNKFVRKFLAWAYRKAGVDARKQKLLERYNVDDKVQKARTGFFETVPFASAGIRTDFDVQKDEEYGVGGVTYWTQRS